MPDASPISDENAAEILCPSCSVRGAFRSEWRERFISQPFVSFSLAGMQDKTVARLVKWPWLVCRKELGGCGKEIQAKEVKQ